MSQIIKSQRQLPIGDSQKTLTVCTLSSLSYIDNQLVIPGIYQHAGWYHWFYLWPGATTKIPRCYSNKLSWFNFQAHKSCMEEVLSVCRANYPILSHKITKYLLQVVHKGCTHEGKVNVTCRTYIPSHPTCDSEGAGDNWRPKLVSWVEFS